LTFGDDFVEAYYVGDFNEQDFKQFEQNIKSATSLVGGAASGVGRKLTRLWPYGDGTGGTISYERIRGDVSTGPSAAIATAKRVASYLVGADVQGQS
jgi:hypothetical protein